MSRSFFRLKQVEAATGLKKSTIYKLMQAGRFPAAIKLSPKATAWASDEVEAWQQQQLDNRDAAADSKCCACAIFAWQQQQLDNRDAAA